MVSRLPLKLSLLCLCSYVSTSVCNSTISYETLGSWYNASFGITQEKKENAVEDKPLQMVLDDAIKRRLVFQLCAQQEKASEGIDALADDECMKTLFQDLEIICSLSGQQNASVFSNIDRTKSFAGKAVLCKYLADNTHLEARRQFIETLIKNKKLFSELSQIVDEVCKVESEFLSFWVEESPASKPVINNLYFGSGFLGPLNRNSMAMESLVRLHNFKTAFLMGNEIILIGAVAAIKSRFTKTRFIDDVKQIGGIFNSIYNPWCGYKALAKVYSAAGQKEIEQELRMQCARAGQVPSEQEFAQGLDFYKKALKIQGFAGFGCSFFMIFAKMMQLRTAFNEARFKQKAMNYLHSRLIGVSSHVRAVARIEQVLNAYAIDRDAFLYVENAQELLAHCEDGSQEIDELLRLLQKNTFTGSPSFFSCSGRVLASYKLMLDHKDKLIPFLQAIGEIDACLSIARLYKEYRKAPQRFSCARFLESDQPVFHAGDVWNILVGAEKAVPNNVLLGDSHVQAMIISGSNTGGKSTLLKSAGVCALLGKTICICPARSCVMTSFDQIVSYFNIKDNIKDGQSTYKAEINRAALLKKTVLDLQPGQHALLLVDELIKGTSVEIGQKKAFEVGQFLVNAKNICLMLATHNPLLFGLEQITNGICKNYKVDAIKLADGTIVRPFKLQEGISTCNIAEEIMNEELNVLGE